MKGFTKHCPNKECGKVVLRYCDFKGEGTFQTKCPHCKEVVQIDLKNETVADVKLAKLLVALFIIVGLFSVMVSTLTYKQRHALPVAQVIEK